MLTHNPRPDWKTERDRINLADLIERETNRKPVTRNGRKWFCCPFHEDATPSLVIRKPHGGQPYFRCYGCDARGDAAGFVMRLRSLTFAQSVAYLTGGPIPTSKTTASPATKPTPKLTPKPSGLPEADALSLVESAAARLWTPDGAHALAYLTGPRCLSVETIRRARIGWTPRADGVAWRPPGVVIPWFNGDRLTMVKIRPPDAWRLRFPEAKRPPKYLECFRDPSRLVSFPSSATIRPGLPLVIVEGEFDALCLGEALGDLAAVITLGSASARPEPHALAPMLAAPRWYIATDADPAGDKAADGWPARARRVRPPGSYKDWTEVKGGGVNLARWWRDILAGIESPELFTWAELRDWRWGDADDSPGIDIHPPGGTS